VPDLRMSSFRQALKDAMEERGHTQKDVEKLTGVSQSLISRLLAGQRKRMTPSVLTLCRYANFEAEGHNSAAASESRLSQSVRAAVGDNADAAALLARIVDALAPALRQYRASGPEASLGVRHDDTRI
jgi:transcriptional regulator with XRE-family HTH domain